MSKKNSTAGAVTESLSEKAQRFRERRDEVRNHLAALGSTIEEQLGLENALAVDEPEGIVQIHLAISKTLAEQLVKSLRHAGSML